MLPGADPCPWLYSIPVARRSSASRRNVSVGTPTNVFGIKNHLGAAFPFGHEVVNKCATSADLNVKRRTRSLQFVIPGKDTPVDPIT